MSTWGKRVGRKLDQIKQLGDSSEKLQYVVTPAAVAAGAVGSNSQPCSPLPPNFTTKTFSAEDTVHADVEGDFANKLKEQLSNLDGAQQSAITQRSNDTESNTGGRENISRNSTLRGCPSKLLMAESESLSRDSAPAAQKELSLRHHKRQTSRAGYGIPPSEDNKLWYT